MKALHPMFLRILIIIFVLCRVELIGHPQPGQARCHGITLGMTEKQVRSILEKAEEVESKPPKKMLHFWTLQGQPLALPIQVELSNDTVVYVAGYELSSGSGTVAKVGDVRATVIQGLGCPVRIERPKQTVSETMDGVFRERLIFLKGGKYVDAIFYGTASRPTVLMLAISEELPPVWQEARVIREGGWIRYPARLRRTAGSLARKQLTHEARLHGTGQV
jgi:hypothetical protein